MKSIKSLAFALLFCLQTPACISFLAVNSLTAANVVRDGSDFRLFLMEDLPILGESCSAESTKQNASLYDSLRSRQNELNNGIGKRYICRTQRGFLNVHKEPGDPFNVDNVVNQLQEGDIVTSMEPPRDGWIRHDSGGWSIAVYNGFTWLEELKD